MVDCIPVIIVLFCKLLILGVSTLGENTRHNYDGFRYKSEYCAAHAIKIFLNTFGFSKQVQLSTVKDKYAGT